MAPLMKLGSAPATVKKPNKNCVERIKHINTEGTRMVEHRHSVPFNLYKPNKMRTKLEESKKIVNDTRSQKFQSFGSKDIKKTISHASDSPTKSKTEQASTINKLMGPKKTVSLPFKIEIDVNDDVGESGIGREDDTIKALYRRQQSMQSKYAPRTIKK